MWLDPPVPLHLADYIYDLGDQIDSLQLHLMSHTGRATPEELAISITDVRWCSNPFCICPHHKSIETAPPRAPPRPGSNVVAASG
jgi:hypothetical protein